MPSAGKAACMTAHILYCHRPARWTRHLHHLRRERWWGLHSSERRLRPLYLRLRFDLRRLLHRQWQRPRQRLHGR